MAQIIDGKKIAQQVKQEVKEKIKQLNDKGIEVTLAVIIVGNNPASRVYVDSKKRDCAEIGIKSIEYALSEDTTEEQLLSLIEKLNNDDKINGILVQMPLPKQIDESKVCKKILPFKDVDGFHPLNVGNLVTGIDERYTLVACTPAGVIEMLERENIIIEGKHVVIVGRSNIVGKPLSYLFLKKNATVTICHSRTKNLEKICQTADILVAAVGKAKMIKECFVKENAIIVDVGINRLEDSKKLVGDVDFDDVFNKAAYITPVPGGVGLMTRAMLMKNVLKAALIQNNLLEEFIID
ncbi:bifunctional methylenetetrahydrofolate dehydrogenase/methenyltetrahydrofolate cyclohydrolase FolD [Caldicellulosiruptoraceae bacterium PP1]